MGLSLPVPPFLNRLLLLIEPYIVLKKEGLLILFLQVLGHILPSREQVPKSLASHDSSRFISINILPFLFLLFMVRYLLISLLNGVLQSLKDLLEGTRLPNRESIQENSLIELLSELIEDYGDILLPLMAPGMRPDGLEALGPERLLDDVLNALDEKLLSLDVGAPLLEDVPLLTHVVILVNLVYYYLDALL